MKIPSEKIGQELGKRIAPVYLVSGDEPLLVAEVCDEIRAALREKGYSERELFHVDGSFDWEQVLFSANSMSLFAEQKILEIRIPGGKPGDKGATALKLYTENPPDDTTMLLVMPRLDAATQKTKWFKALDGAGVFVQVWPIGIAQLPRWLGERFRRAGLNADREAVDALIDRIEGNLLAAIQEIERLRLVSDNDRIGLQDIVEGVADSSRYDVFSLIDAAVAQDFPRALKIVQGLKLEGAEPLYIVNMLAREFRSLAGMAVAIERGSTVEAAIGAARVWPKRKSLVARCLRVHDSKTLLGFQRDASRIDKLVKGIGQGDPWTELTNLVLALAGRPVLPAKVTFS